MCNNALFCLILDFSYCLQILWKYQNQQYVSLSVNTYILTTWKQKMQFFQVSPDTKNTDEATDALASETVNASQGVQAP